MKHTIIAILLLLPLALTAATPDEANQLYADGQYQAAAEMYQALLAEQPAAEFYYNLGNARFKQGELAQSILAYERALRLKPGMKDAKHNLKFAESQIQDNIADTSEFFLRTWFIRVRNSLSFNSWIWLSMIGFWMLLVGLLIFALSREPALRKAAFTIAMLMLLQSAITGINALSKHNSDTARAEAIITQGIVNAKSSPDRSGTDLFTLHEGTKVYIKDNIGDWVCIHVGNYVGWIRESNLERI